MEGSFLRKSFYGLIISILFLSFAISIFYSDLVLAPQSILIKNEHENEPLISNTKSQSENMMRGVWYSYLDWLNLMNQSTENGAVSAEKFKQNVEKVCSNLSSISTNNLFLHVRAFGDAFYPSDLAVRSKFLKNLNLSQIDPLKFFINCAKKHNIKVHGWMNPMRVFNTADFEKVPDDFEIKKWFSNEKQRHDYFVGIDAYDCWVLNPCNEQVVNLIISIEQELLKNYNLDGIHIDDYFFPTAVKHTNYDLAFQKKVAPNVEINQFRFQGVSNLIKKMHDKCHEMRPDAVFGAAIIGNLNVNKSAYADVEAWVKQGIVDYLMPEIYYSFKNLAMPFNRCVQEWNSLIEKSKTKLKLYVGLAAYKLGKEHQKNDQGWQEIGNILQTQHLHCAKNLKNYEGYCLFDYKSIFDEAGNKKLDCSKELDALNSCFN